MEKASGRNEKHAESEVCECLDGWMEDIGCRGGPP